MVTDATMRSHKYPRFVKSPSNAWTVTQLITVRCGWPFSIHFPQWRFMRESCWCEVGVGSRTLEGVCGCKITKQKTRLFSGLGKMLHVGLNCQKCKILNRTWCKVALDFDSKSSQPNDFYELHSRFYSLTFSIERD